MASGRSAAAQAFAEDRIPTYRIDLSLPPRERYVEPATDFAPRMRRITPLFDIVLASFIPWSFLRSIVRFSASLRLRRVHSHEETQELKGIAKASGVDMYFLVAFNLLLDALLGCTSGGVLTRPEGDKGSGRSRQEGRRSLRRMKRMMHFRTLDWGMPELRDVLVVLEFVRSASPDPEKVILRTVSYAGFVGTLTGVRYVSHRTPEVRELTISGKTFLFRSTSAPITTARPCRFASTRPSFSWAYGHLYPRFCATASSTPRKGTQKLTIWPIRYVARAPRPAMLSCALAGKPSCCKRTSTTQNTDQLMILSCTRITIFRRRIPQTGLLSRTRQTSF